MKTKLRSPQKDHKKLLINALSNIVSLEANINYTIFNLHTGRTQTMSYCLAMYAVLLPSTFIRIHRSSIINKNFVKKLNPDTKRITMKDGTEFQISRRRWHTVSENLA